MAKKSQSKLARLKELAELHDAALKKMLDDRYESVTEYEETEEERTARIMVDSSAWRTIGKT